MNIREFPQVIHELYATHMVLTSWGLRSDDLYVGCAKDPEKPEMKERYYVLVHTEDGNQFVIAVGERTTGTVPEALQLWHDFAIQVETAKDEDLRYCGLQSQLSSSVVLRMNLLTALKSRGFKVFDPEHSMGFLGGSQVRGSA